jgi:5-methylcytosine-specific restriction endonuclease McrA
VSLAKPVKRARKAKRPLRRKAKRKMRLHHADALFSTYIRTRDGWACTRCGSPVMPQCAHLHSRVYRAIRFNPDNATTLCKGCHVMFTHKPIEWADWCEERWPGRLAVLRVQALAAHEHVDFDAVCEALRSSLGVKP